VNHAWRLIRREDLRHYRVKGEVYPWAIHSASMCDGRGLFGIGSGAEVCVIPVGLSSMA